MVREVEGSRKKRRENKGGDRDGPTQIKIRNQKNKEKNEEVCLKNNIIIKSYKNE